MTVYWLVVRGLGGRRAAASVSLSLPRQRRAGVVPRLRARVARTDKRGIRTFPQQQGEEERAAGTERGRGRGRRRESLHTGW